MKRITILLMMLVLLSIDAFSQCSMCSAVVESSQKTGSEFAEGLNAGILYLMGVPYALIVVLGVLLFRNMNRNNAGSDQLQP